MNTCEICQKCRADARYDVFRGVAFLQKAWTCYFCRTMARGYGLRFVLPTTFTSTRRTNQ